MSTNAGSVGTPARDASSRGQRDGSSRRRPNRPGRGEDTPRRPQPVKFTGKEDGLGDEFIYQLTSGRDATDQYARTTEEIIRYSSTKYKNGADVERSLSDEQRLVITTPAEPAAVGQPPRIPETQMAIWKMEYQLSIQRTASLEVNMQSMYALIKGQCSKPILEKVEAQNEYTVVHQARDPIGLLNLIKAVMFNYNSRKYRATTIIELIKPGSVYQTKQMSMSEYLEKFRTQMEVILSAGGEFCTHTGMVEDELERMNAANPPTEAETRTGVLRAKQRFEAALFLVRSDQSRYGRLVQELANDFNKGTDSYPSTLTAAYELMLHDVRDQDTKIQSHGAPGMAFNTVGTTTARTGVPATDSQPNPRPDVTCHKCGKDGHFLNKCNESTHADGTVLVHAEIAVADSAVSTISGVGEPPANPGVALTLLASVELDDDDYGFQFMCCTVIETTTEVITDGTLHSQHKKATGCPIPLSWILLDSQSTVDVFCNRSLLRNIRTSPNSCRISCNAGVVTTNLIGDLPGYPEPVWYHPDGIANILSLHKVVKHCRVQYDSTEARASFQVTRADGSIRAFYPSTSGLHYCDTNVDGTVLVNTVEENLAHYTRRAVKRASLARRIQDIIGRPSTRDFIKIVEGGMLHNCPITKADIKAAEDIFGTNLGSLKGKTVRKKNIHVRSLVSDVPYDIIRRHKNVVLCFDIMFVNKIAFLITVSRSIRFGTTERLMSRKADLVGKALTDTIVFYKKRGFRVVECVGDGEFEVLRADLADVGSHLNITAENEHVPEAERYIRTVKDRARSAYNVLPFARMPGIMIVELVHASNYWLNMFPAKDGVSAIQSPRRILTGQVGDYNLHCQLQFGEYAQVHESHDNTMMARTTGAIALRPTGNVQGGYYFLSLSSGKRLNRYAWTALPMPEEVINRVHVLARRNPAGGAIEFGWRDGNEILDEAEDVDDLHDLDYVPDTSDSEDGGSPDESDGEDSSDESDDDGSEPDDDADHGELEGSDDESDRAPDRAPDPHNQPPPEPEDTQEDSGSGSPANDESEEDSVENDDEGPSVTGNAMEASNTHEGMEDDSEGMDKEVHADHHGSNVAANLNDDPDDDDSSDQSDHPLPDSESMEQRYGKRTRVGLRRRKPPRSPSRIKEPQSSAHHALNVIIADELNGLAGFLDITHTALTQYSLKQGLKRYGKAGANAVIKEMQQLHDRKVIRPRMARMLTLSEKRRALGYLMFLKEKRCGTIKGRGCADGRKQRLYKTKEETSSPTVRTESLLLSCVIDAKEGRHVVTCDVPGAFMQVDVDEVVHVRLVGPLAELLTKVDPKLYTQYLATESGKSVMYVQLQKALYGTISAAMLFWKDLSGFLMDEGFVANPYDSCVMNKEIGGKQCTVLWHVDDLKISHVVSSVIDGVLDSLNQKYGKESPLTVTRGDVHDYLGMTIDYSVKGKVIIRMRDYIKNMLDDLPEGFLSPRIVTSPAANHLFTVDLHATLLDMRQSDLFHSVTAKLLFLCKRARPDIQTGVAFLCTRVIRPDADDGKKLCRVLQYLRGTIELDLTLEADNLQIIKWWVDASFAVHKDMRSHTGGTMSLGKGAIYSVSTRQKLNTKSSTEAELVGVDDLMPMILWTRQFMEGQGYVICDNVVYQDNQSAMLLENNGQRSSTKRTRHLDIRFFFVTDRILAKQLRVEYCPTGDMWADVFTKPLQGAPFIKFRNLILNI